MKKMLRGMLIGLGMFSSMHANALESVSSGGNVSEIGLDIGLAVMETTLETQTKKLKEYIGNVKLCNNKNMLFAPGHPSADGDRCVYASEADGSAFNYAFEPDLDNNANATQGRPNDLGMETCAEGEFVTSNGKTDVKCEEIGGGAVVKPGDSCAAQTTYLGGNPQAVPEMENGETMSFEYEACNSAESAATLYNQDVTCTNGILVKNETVQNCSWKNSGSKCEFSPSASCKTTVGQDCAPSNYRFEYTLKSEDKTETYRLACDSTLGKVNHQEEVRAACKTKYHNGVNDEADLIQYKKCDNGTLLDVTSVNIILETECGNTLNTCKKGIFKDMNDSETEAKWWCLDIVSTEDKICSAPLEKNEKNKLEWKTGKYSYSGAKYKSSDASVQYACSAMEAKSGQGTKSGSCDVKGETNTYFNPSISKNGNTYSSCEERWYEQVCG